MGSQKEGVRPLAQGCLRGQCANCLFDGVGFARQGCLIDEEIPRVQQQTIARDDIAGTQDDHVSRNDLLNGDLLLAAITQHRGLGLDDGEQLLDRIRGSPLLEKAQQGTRQDDRQDNECIGAVLEEER
jgi:hypothetical protein